jgi:hypothetical protein
MSTATIEVEVRKRKLAEAEAKVKQAKKMLRQAKRDAIPKVYVGSSFRAQRCVYGQWQPVSLYTITHDGWKWYYDWGVDEYCLEEEGGDSYRNVEFRSFEKIPIEVDTDDDPDEVEEEEEEEDEE